MDTPVFHVELKDKTNALKSLNKNVATTVEEMSGFEVLNLKKDHLLDSEVSSSGSGSKFADQKSKIKMEVEKLQQELKKCQSELHKMQRQLEQSVRLQEITESYNQDLRLQVEKLSAELHEWKKKERNRVESETQTEEYRWTETDYSYYYNCFYQMAEGTGPQKNSEFSDVHPTTTEWAAANSPQLEKITDMADAEIQTGDKSSLSIAGMLKATAEEALNQTGFVFDESSGMYYDYATGFYYDSNSQLYYDANTGIYYSYDTDSGKYQFHSQIKLPAVQLCETVNDQETTSKWKLKKTSERTELAKTMDQSGKKKLIKDTKIKEQHDNGKCDKMITKKKGRCSRSRKHSSSSFHSVRSTVSSVSPRKSRSQIRNTSHSKKRSHSPSRMDSCSVDVNSESEPEEGEIMGSEGEKEPFSSSTSLSDSPVTSPAPDSPVNTMQPPEEGWPPCIRVTVVRSSVLQPGTLFILTADAVATIGREKDMDHAIRIPEMGVSKSHAEVYFDQDHQCYMLVDLGSQNGTVINGSRILQPKVRCDPCPLTHGDEVKLGETVLSFHIHSGTDTCNGCEPGQVRAHLSFHRREENAGCVLSKEDKEIQRHRELKLIKIKYGLKNSDYENSHKCNKYKDRAESRRQTVGSEGTFYRDDAPASLHVEISEKNKGRQMLEKMGWKSGEGLGRDKGGIIEPVELQVRREQSGLGCVGTVSVNAVSLGHSKRQQNWEQARERFQQSHLEMHTSKQPQNWVRGQPDE
ncbi:angiogenic factor with G patch and FHA domains 1 isoform X2 [Trichomycterus rosablanca]|uniref:angiogenic factor with G patch and FHA domains 1 isoform X2 n=1 Tax=Trichomycterus rosablanca TaxID=2290929 RepID=UPI002F3524C9